MSCVRARSALTALVNPRRRKKELSSHHTERKRHLIFIYCIMISPPEGWTIIWEETLAIQMKIYGSLI
jgi:hypothetical protein